MGSGGYARVSPRRGSARGATWRDRRSRGSRGHASACRGETRARVGVTIEGGTRRGGTRRARDLPASASKSRPKPRGLRNRTTDSLVRAHPRAPRTTGGYFVGADHRADTPEGRASRGRGLTRGFGVARGVARATMPPSFSFGRKPAAKPKAPPDPHARVAELAKLLCESGGPAPDPELLKALKREVRRGEAQMRRAHEALLSSLAHRECGPRSHAVAVFDELFHRSAQFRARAPSTASISSSSEPSTRTRTNTPCPAPRRRRTPSSRAPSGRSTGGTRSSARTSLDSPSRLDSSPTCSARTRQPREKPPRARRRRNRPARKRPGARTMATLRDGRGTDSASRRGRDRARHGRVPTRALLGGDRDDPVAEVDDDEWEDVAFESDGGVVDCAATPVRANGDVPNARIDQGAVGFGRSVSRGIVHHRRGGDGGERGDVGRTRGALPRRRSTVGTRAGRRAPSSRASRPRRVASHPRNARTPSTFSRGRSEGSWMPSIGVAPSGWTPETRRDEEEKSTEENARVRSAEEQEAAATGAAARGPNDETSDGGMRITVAGVASPRDGEDAALVAAAAAREDAALDALLDRARRRREWTRRAAGRGGGGGGRGNVPGAPFWMGRSANVRTRGGGGVGDAETGSTPSVRRRAKKIFASQVSAHNSEVMRELGEAGVERRDGITGFDERTRRVREVEANEDAARALAEAEARETKRDERRPRRGNASRPSSRR